MRTELHSESIKIEQNSDLIGDEAIRDRSSIVVADKSLNKEYLDELAFNEEPVTIRLEPSSEKNAATWFPVWVNGKGAEVLINDKWIEFKYLPVGQILVVKRKYIEVLLRAKIDTVTTEVTDVQTDAADNKQNRVKRFTSAVQSFSVLHDKNPLGAVWLNEIRRRNM